MKMGMNDERCVGGNLTFGDYEMKGFTLIELMIVFAMIAIVGVVVAGSSEGQSNISFGINGLTETRCINGYQFIVGSSGSAQQVLGANGGGVTCK